MDRVRSHLGGVHRLRAADLWTDWSPNAFVSNGSDAFGNGNICRLR